MFKVHTKRSKTRVPISIPPDLVSLVVDPGPSNLIISIKLCKGKQYTTMHLIFHFISYDCLSSLDHQLISSLSLVFVPKSY